MINTVQELIKRLQECNPNAVPFVYDIDSEEPIPIHSIDGGFQDNDRVDINCKPD